MKEEVRGRCFNSICGKQTKFEIEETRIIPGILSKKIILPTFSFYIFGFKMRLTLFEQFTPYMVWEFVIRVYFMYMTHILSFFVFSKEWNFIERMGEKKMSHLHLWETNKSSINEMRILRDTLPKDTILPTFSF